MKPVSNNSAYRQIKTILTQAKQAVHRAVNFSMVVTYWQMGKIIVETEQYGKRRAGYGDALITDLSKKLTAEFGKGYTATNLKYFRQFYLTFPESVISHAPRGLLQAGNKFSTDAKSHAAGDQSGKGIRTELSWTHYRLLIGIEDKAARNWYMNEAAENNWSTRSLERQISTLTYQRILSSKNKDAVKKEADARIEAVSALDFIKDPYVLEFLQLPSNKDFYEKDIESAIISKLQHFILELGKGFSFVSRQKRISAEDDHFYIDLVFYNYILKCFVLIDLKLGKLSHQDIGQMDLYVRWWEENEKTTTDNPTIGIILCSQKNETIVKYSVLKGSKQLFASRYKLYLPSEDELKHEVNEGIASYQMYHTQ